MNAARFPGESFSGYKARLKQEKQSMKALLRGSWIVRNEKPLPPKPKKPSEDTKTVPT